MYMLLLLVACTSGSLVVLDLDGDGFCDQNMGWEICLEQYPSQPMDCDDQDPDVHPYAEEVCGNQVDDNCDGSRLDPVDLWFDMDGDGWGSDRYAGRSCDDIADTAPQTGDCDDQNPDVNPGAQEVCDYEHTDENCDGEVNEDGLDPVVWVPDEDHDGWTGDDWGLYCEGPENWVPYWYMTTPADCNDHNPGVYPGNGCPL